MTLFDDVAAELARLGLVLTNRPSEYCVNSRGGGDATAYFTDDLTDALEYGRAVAAALATTAPAAVPLVRGRRKRRQTTGTKLARHFYQGS